MQQRELTPSETRAIGLVKLFDQAAEERKNAITLFGQKDAAEVVGKLHAKGAIRQVRITWDAKAQKYAIMFMLPEFYKYVLFILRQTGLQLQVDGSLKTFDNLFVSNEYLN